MTSCSCQKGNVLFLILLAVALFAALSYAITSSTRNSGGSVSKDAAKANAAALVQYGSALRQGVRRLKISNGCADTSLNFGNLIYKKNDGSYTNISNSGAPTNKSCDLFDPAGGNMTPVVVNIAAMDPNNVASQAAGASAIGHGAFRGFQMKGIGTDDVAGTVTANDISFYVPYVNLQTCLAINDMFQVNNPGGVPPTLTLTGTPMANLHNGSLATNAIWEGPDINGQPTYCGDISGAYHFVQVIVER